MSRKAKIPGFHLTAVYTNLMNFCTFLCWEEIISDTALVCTVVGILNHHLVLRGSFHRFCACLMLIATETATWQDAVLLPNSLNLYSSYKKDAEGTGNL